MENPIDSDDWKLWFVDTFFDILDSASILADAPMKDSQTLNDVKMFMLGLLEEIVVIDSSERTRQRIEEVAQNYFEKHKEKLADLEEVTELIGNLCALFEKSN